MRLLFVLLCLIGAVSSACSDSLQFYGLIEGETYVVKLRERLVFLRLGSGEGQGINGSEQYVELRTYSESEGLTDVKVEKMTVAYHSPLNFFKTTGPVFLAPRNWFSMSYNNRTPKNPAYLSLVFNPDSKVEYLSPFAISITDVDGAALKEGIRFRSVGFHPHLRLWCSTDGRLLEGRFIQQDNGHVRIDGLEGEKWLFPVDRLSTADLEFLRVVELDPDYDMRNQASVMSRLQEGVE
ncbi:hypothetical protein [Coraliomargarita parva]|uniref:hypothetical protein n=1 Tax=Coraliomargarita parva TaxID=3014050 RepID=UPI0022B3821F|nr:hypothetical protein [Coraliomargarita parva]